MAAIKTWSMDGTFKIIPHWYQQLFTIHAIAPGKLMSEVYCPCTAKHIDKYLIIYGKRCVCTLTLPSCYTRDEHTTVKIELLGNENYDTWKLQAQATLVKNDLWEFVNGTKRRPKTKWDISDQKAKADLILSISPLELREIKDCETSIEIRLKFASIYKSRGPARKAAFLKRLILNKMSDEQKMYDFSRDELPKPEVLKIKLPEECEARMNREPKHNDAMFARGKCRLKNSQRAIEKSRRKDNEKSQKQRKIVQIQVPSLLKGGAHGEALSIKPCWSATATTNALSNDPSRLLPGRNIRNFPLHWWPIPLKMVFRLWSIISHLERLSSLGSDGVRSVKLDNRLYVLDLRSNLISVAKITEKGFKGIFQGNSAIITNQNLGTVMVAHKEDGLYYVESPALIAATAESKVPTLMEWHRRLGHLNERSLIELTKHEKVFGIKVGKEKLPVCEICIKGKQTQSLFSKSQTKRRCGPLELMHTDICGPMRQNSIGGSKYFVTFIDDHSRWCETYFLKNRNEVLDAFMDFKSHAEDEIGNKIKTEKFQKFLRVNGIRHETSVQYTSQQNGVAERKNRTLLDIARYMLLESKLSFNFWAEAISTACYIRNCCPSRSLNGEIPLTLWNGRKFTLNYFRIFREWAHVLDKSPGKGNFSTRSKECIFIGYSTELKAYRLWCPAERKLTAQNQEWPANDIREMENETLELQLTPNISNDTHQSKDTLVQSEADQVTETRKIKALLKARLVRSGRCRCPKKVSQKEKVQPISCEDVALIAQT
ncbi:Retrovirus-related Pol polyprotein from transposon TNT 1-94 [Trichinella pseudospiralis]|uniref:Retrovirus-related Pol polyprotein from transposon TNT 1-94 n=1 Tax=Trichinella pseudospiralis TaxID=6337 RepID=A0A0V1DUK6_TRIPS|nr:Retrovirus-related Pol polyprotein from transposon TNT 1-94 [Trichinella pseudospiralis]